MNNLDFTSYTVTNLTIPAWIIWSTVYTVYDNLLIGNTNRSQFYLIWTFYGELSSSCVFCHLTVTIKPRSFHSHPGNQNSYESTSHHSSVSMMNRQEASNIKQLKQIRKPIKFIHNCFSLIYRYVCFLWVFFTYFFILYSFFIALPLFFYFLLVTSPLNRVTLNHGAI